MSKEPIYFDLPSDEKDQKLVAAILAQAACQILKKQEPSEYMARKRVAKIYHSILNPVDAEESNKRLF